MAYLDGAVPESAFERLRSSENTGCTPQGLSLALNMLASHATLGRHNRAPHNDLDWYHKARTDAHLGHIGILVIQKIFTFCYGEEMLDEESLFREEDETMDDEILGGEVDNDESHNHFWDTIY